MMVGEKLWHQLDYNPFMESLERVLMLYIPGSKGQELSFQVGQNNIATVKFSGPITQEVIADTLAHLAFYKKYFPKTIEADAGSLTAQGIIDQMRAILDDAKASLPTPEQTK